MKKKNLIILLSVLLAVVITAAILIVVNTDWLNSDDTTGGDTGAANELPTIEAPTISVEETEPSLGSGGEIDFDDLWNAANGD